MLHPADSRGEASMSVTAIGRRMFLLTAVAWAALRQRVGAAAGGRQAATAPAWPGVVLQADEGEHLVSGRRRGAMRIKVDSRSAIGATMSMLISEVAPGANIPVHLHRNEDELIFIHTGAGMVTLGEERIASTAGAILYAPRGVWHGVENTGRDTLTWCAIYSPPGFEQYFREVGVPAGSGAPGPSPEVLAKTAEKYGMVFKDAR
jgi:mannose-6-phosphate isomerase-like protein (cupin superfamily)